MLHCHHQLTGAGDGVDDPNALHHHSYSIKINNTPKRLIIVGSTTTTKSTMKSHWTAATVIHVVATFCSAMVLFIYLFFNYTHTTAKHRSHKKKHLKFYWSNTTEGSHTHTQHHQMHSNWGGGWDKFAQKIQPNCLVWLAKICSPHFVCIYGGAGTPPGTCYNVSQNLFLFKVC